MHAERVYHHGMKTIQIRNVPDETHRKLRARAAASGLSLSDYLLNEVVEFAGQPSIAEVLARAQAIPASVPTEVIVQAVRSGRDRE